MKKRLLLAVCTAALLSLTACEKTETVSDSVPESASGYIPPISPASTENSGEDSESSSETSDVSTESEPEKITECPYKVGDPVGSEDLPSRGRAAYMVTKTTIYLQSGRNNKFVELFDEHDNSLYRERDYGEPEISSYEYDDKGNAIREYYAANYYCDSEYDENGRLVSYAAFKDGEPHFSGEMIFDEHGELLEAHTMYYPNDGEPGETVRYYDNIYDGSGRKISSTEYDTDHTKIWEINDYEYDGDKLKRRVCTEPRDAGKRVTEYDYDTDGNIVNYKTTLYDDDGAVKSTHREERSYNADGKIEQMLYYNKDGELEMKELYEYVYADKI